MPRVPDASSVTRLRAIQSSAVADPTKRSASYTPAAPALLYSLRASDAGRGMFPAQTCLSNPVTCGYVNPRHRGFLTGPSAPAPLPRIYMDLVSVDFDGSNKRYEFGTDVSPPGSDFEAMILDAEDATPSNVDLISYISIFDFSGEDLYDFTNTTITTTPVWSGSTFTSSAAEPNLSADSGTFPGLATIITFRNVPVQPNLAIQFYGNTPP